MKDKVLFLILGVLIGAIITSLIFIFVVNKNNGPQDFKDRSERMERPDDMGNFIPTEGEMPEGRERGKRLSEEPQAENE